jgi:AraC family transcriptional regulator of adaptative response / DNA-3-methyladenine glycosylase II
VALDEDACYRALLVRDARFDGAFFVGVRTTGVYCRPICPARTPRRDRCSFFERAALAEQAGYRACFRCRPEVAPRGIASVDAASALAARAARRIDEGALDEGSLESLARELGVTSRHVRRAMDRELGVSPLAYARTRRLALAKQLMTDARLPLTDVAFGAGYRSVRRFNAEFRERFGCSPSASKLARRSRRGAPAIELRLDHRLPYDWPALLAFLGARAVPGVEHVDSASYTRALAVEGAAGVVRVQRADRPGSVVVRVSAPLARALPLVVCRVRALFDLDARPDLVDAALRRDASMRASLRAHPGLRVPGTLDPFEGAIRAVLAQQVSTRAARTLGGRLAERFGAAIAVEDGSPVHRVFPDARALAALRPEAVAAIGLPIARARTLVALADAVASGRVGLGSASPVAEQTERLLAIPGIGPFTASVIAMRALGWPDAFPANDLVVLRALGARTAAKAEAASQHLSPFRSYYVMHLWQRAAEGEGSC